MAAPAKRQRHLFGSISRKRRAPFAAMGFIKYNGMTAERLFLAWLYSALLMPKVLTFRATNIYYEAVKPVLGGKHD